MTTRDGINTALKQIGLAGYSGVAITAPSAVIGLEKLLAKSSTKNIDIQRVIAELRRQKLVAISKKANNWSFIITPAGAYRLQELAIFEIKINFPKKWDHRWRLVTFDIPVKFSTARMNFVDELKKRGFVMIQKSMWVHPSDCFKQVEQIAQHYNVMRYCTLIEILKIDDQTAQRLLGIFGSKLNA